MNSFALYITTAFALILVIEGLFYALFPDLIRKMMAMAIMLPVKNLRLFGLIMAASGLTIIGLLPFFLGLN